MDGSPASDLRSEARIRNAALECFAEQGVAATSIRVVAAAAGVSPGLVQHHFATKEGLHRAVDAYVLERALKHFSPAVPGDTTEQVAAAMGRRVAEFIERDPLAFKYLGRGLFEGTDSAGRLFDTLVGIAQAQLERLADDGLLYPGTDIAWAALHLTFANLAPFLLEGHVSRRLGNPLRAPAEVHRFSSATSALVLHGLLVPGKRRRGPRYAGW